MLLLPNDNPVPPLKGHRRGTNGCEVHGRPSLRIFFLPQRIIIATVTPGRVESLFQFLVLLASDRLREGVRGEMQRGPVVHRQAAHFVDIECEAIPSVLFF